MLEPDFLESLPEDDALAFLAIEEKAREIVEHSVTSETPANFDRQMYRRYIATVLGAAEELNVIPFSGYHYDDYTIDIFRSLSEEIDSFRIKKQLSHLKMQREYSVRLDESARSVITHHIERLKSAVSNLDVTDIKRSAIQSKIAALESEITRARTRFEVFGALIVATADGAAEVASKLEPVWKVIERIAGVLNNSKQQENTTPQLPAPTEPKKLEPPKKQLPPPKAS